ncbi:hypothetical protein IV38_GL001216 [Lactobacillus selangorensis]|uniref:Uncharacterized protein n=1 Tax=Lactobacillus selangorensis TaxID=81857 RepID=A0A0R2G5T3_9LACO|nr:hypothetical protein [Lactobacillus selangorensis]KRN29002.1 hypothetical protein IV38_GL001216 [Lactobacillus selangorensis]KRN32588.1 hypothetical protein IV40_GL000637 [Lactobacillus selangorensis]
MTPSTKKQISLMSNVLKELKESDIIPEATIETEIALGIDYRKPFTDGIERAVEALRDDKAEEGIYQTAVTDMDRPLIDSLFNTALAKNNATGTIADYPNIVLDISHSKTVITVSFN